MPYAQNGPCEIYYEAFGDKSDPALVLVNGLGSQCINYADDWVAQFVAHDLYVIRFDNRDVGFTTSFADAPKGPMGEAYLVSDMAADIVAILDAEGIPKAHVHGLSMGGMIVQVLAIEHPDRLFSAISVMSTTGEPHVGQSTPEARANFAPVVTDRESYIIGGIAGLRAWGSPEFADPVRWRNDLSRAYDRSYREGATDRQFAAIAAAPPRAERLKTVTVPVLVIHGDKDTLIDQSGGRRTAELVPDASFVLIEGMGHDYPPQIWDTWVGHVTTFISALTI